MEYIFPTTHERIIYLFDYLKQLPIHKRLMDRHLSSLGRVWVAIKEKSRLNLINILRELHSSDDLLFLKFG